MQKLKQIIEQSDTRSGKVFDYVIQAMIILSLVSFSIETLPDLSADSRKTLKAIEIICIAVFTVEYIARIIVATNKPTFIFSFFGIIDALAILPFYLASGLDLRSIRSFRLLRLIRIMKLARYNAAAKRFHRAFIIAKEEIVLFLFASLIVLYLAAAGIYHFENPAQPEKFSSIFHSLWWAVTTLTTVGYGDMYPVTAGGRLFTFFVLVIGLGIVAIPAGLVASALSKAREMED
ncbi:Cyclic nucleotide-gated potassium channel [Gimesia panareensis]|uniref:Cyclic nucleotide-gated potassium channel n=1 Tax=Gimesia panareensis TaxID=2527978 RepID=A0A518FV53_9PLAN|nr:ion transporter [Gimesia panareensis]QDV20214.1 Cyclic nucleotide-gated potassium channel [Gimesia panareensis]